jgi:hypothetical protein
MNRRDEMNTQQNRYIQCFKDWMDQWKPHAFVTMNLPNARRAPRPESFYLTCWTRAAEADLLGARTLKLNDINRRIVWLLRREISPDGLLHYHAVVKFPTARPWREERTPGWYSVIDRCQRLQSALCLASSRTPEPFTATNGYQPSAANVDVRSYDRERNHAGYLLKGMREFYVDDEHEREFTTHELLRDSGLTILPHVKVPAIKRTQTENQPALEQHP